MNNLFNFLLRKHTLVTLVTILIILDILLISNLIVPQVLKFLIDKHIFEIIVITSLIEIFILLSSHRWRVTPLTIGSEEEAQDKLRTILRENSSIKCIKILSAGLKSRANFLRDTLEKYKNINLEIIACFGEKSPNPDKWDREKIGPSHFEVITERISDEERKRIKIFTSFNRPSFRCVLLYDSRGPNCGLVGWYTYYERDTKITGRRNVQIFVDKTTETGVDLLHFAEKMFTTYASEKESYILFPQNEKEQGNNE